MDKETLIIALLDYANRPVDDHADDAQFAAQCEVANFAEFLAVQLSAK